MIFPLKRGVFLSIFFLTSMTSLNLFSNVVQFEDYRFITAEKVSLNTGAPAYTTYVANPKGQIFSFNNLGIFTKWDSGELPSGEYKEVKMKSLGDYGLQKGEVILNGRTTHPSYERFEILVRGKNNNFFAISNGNSVYDQGPDRKDIERINIGKFSIGKNEKIISTEYLKLKTSPGAYIVYTAKRKSEGLYEVYMHQQVPGGIDENNKPTKKLATKVLSGEVIVEPGAELKDIRIGTYGSSRASITRDIVDSSRMVISWNLQYISKRGKNLMLHAPDSFAQRLYGNFIPIGTIGNNESLLKLDQAKGYGNYSFHSILVNTENAELTRVKIKAGVYDEKIPSKEVVEYFGDLKLERMNKSGTCGSLSF